MHREDEAPETSWSVHMYRRKQQLQPNIKTVIQPNYFIQQIYPVVHIKGVSSHQRQRGVYMPLIHVMFYFLVGLKACSMQQFEQIGGVSGSYSLQGTIKVIYKFKYLREQIQLLQDLCQHRSYEIPLKLRSLGCSGAESLWCRGGTEPHQQSVQQCPLPAILEGGLDCY